MRTRASIFPRLVWRSRAASSPPSRISAMRSRRSLTSVSIAAQLAMNSFAPGLTWLASGAISEQLNRHGGCFSAANAQSSDAAFQSMPAQCVQQCYDNARAGGADGVAQRACAAMHIHLLLRNIQLTHRSKRHNGKSFIDFEKIDFTFFPTRLLQDL